MQKNTSIIIAVGVVALIVGLGIGYQAGGKKVSSTHLMPDGQMMHGSANMSMADMMNTMNAELRGKTGDAFDQAFLAEMIVHHEGAVEMAELALTNAKHQEIKNLAAAIITAQNKEIAEMKAWQQSWYGR